MATFTHSIRTSRELGLLLRERRRELGRTQAQVAAQIGASRQWLVGVEAGAGRSELGLILRLVRALDLTLRLEEASPTPPGPINLDAVVDAYTRGGHS
ncbi:MAG: helix-turn-helix domain-containing protein [Candidatus Dormibacteria bacterium]